MLDLRLDKIMVMRRLDPRTKLALGLMAMAAVFVAQATITLVLECLVLLIALWSLGMRREWLRFSRFFWPMIGLVFIIALVSFDLSAALVLSIRLLNLLTISFIFFRAVSPEEMGGALGKMGIPFEFTFILTTGMRYVPLIGEKIRQIIEAQSSRGIDLRPKLRNIKNILALLMPLLVQSFVLADDLAIAMESRGFGRKGRSSRRQYRLTFWEYGLMAASLTLLVVFAWWERGGP
jgi:energy-coupling factor transport system permease protein